MAWEQQTDGMRSAFYGGCGMTLHEHEDGTLSLYVRGDLDGENPVPTVCVVFQPGQLRWLAEHLSEAAAITEAVPAGEAVGARAASPAPGPTPAVLPARYQGWNECPPIAQHAHANANEWLWWFVRRDKPGAGGLLRDYLAQYAAEHGAVREPVEAAGEVAG